jgi:epoxide hydrolase
MFYWLTNTGASSARLYWETFNPAVVHPKPEKVTLPAGVSVFPEETMAGPRAWSERGYTDLVYWNEVDKGGHFAAFEQPQLFVQEMRQWLRNVR